MGRHFHVWNSERPEEGSVVVHALHHDEAQAKYLKMNGADGIELEIIECGPGCVCKREVVKIALPPPDEDEMRMFKRGRALNRADLTGAP